MRLKVNLLDRSFIGCLPGREMHIFPVSWFAKLCQTGFEIGSRGAGGEKDLDLIP